MISLAMMDKEKFLSEYDIMADDCHKKEYVQSDNFQV
jgi:hypothetical protein